MSGELSSSFYNFSNLVASRVLCFVGGYVDCVGFLLVKQLFVASITGNIIKFVLLSTEGIFGSGFVVATLFFGVGAGIARVMALFFKSKPRFDRHLLGFYYLLIESILLLCAMLAGNFLADNIKASDINSMAVLGLAMMMSTAMGLQVGAAQNVFQGFPMTTGMTATVASSVSISFSIALIYMEKYNVIAIYLSNEEKNKLAVEQCDSESASIIPYKTCPQKIKIINEKSIEAWTEFDKQLAPLLSFTIGALVGGVLTEVMEWWSLSIPLFLVFELAIETLLLRSALLPKKKATSFVSMATSNDTEKEMTLTQSRQSPTKFYALREQVTENMQDFEI